MRKGILASAILACVACSGSSSPASVSGTIGGQSFGAQDSVSNVLSIGFGSAGVVLITNAPNTCGKLSAGQEPRNAQAVFLLVGNQTAGVVSAPTAAGSFTVHDSATVGSFSGPVAVAQYQAIDANCLPIAQIEAISGTVTLTRVDSTGYAGTFDLTFSDASHATGSFTANQCAALTMNISGTCT
jgi:hypothetical protein